MEAYPVCRSFDSQRLAQFAAMPENTNEDYDEVKNFREEDATTTDVEEELKEAEAKKKTSSSTAASEEGGNASKATPATPTFASQSPMYPMMFPQAALSPAFIPMMMMPNPFMSPNPMLQMQAAPFNPLFGAMSPSFALAAATAQMRLGGAAMPLSPMHAMNPMAAAAAAFGMQMGGGLGMHEQAGGGGGGKLKAEKRIKKPRNAFFVFKDEHRLKLRENPENARMTEAELNKECGRIWTTMKETGGQQKYIELAKKENEAHKEQYPDWSASANYAAKKKAPGDRKRHVGYDIENKKCRAKFGIDNDSMWCLPCRRKKKCLYSKSDDAVATTSSAESVGSVTNGSVSSTSTPSPMNTATNTPDVSHDEAHDEEVVNIEEASDDDEEEIDPTIMQLTSEAQQHF